MANGAQQMGIGALGDNNIVFKRKFRWTFTVNNICSDGARLSIPPNFVKIASRPSLSIEETELNYLNGKTYLPGKASWNTMTVTYLDVANTTGLTTTTGGGNPANLFTWIYDVYDFRSQADGASPNQLNMGSRRSDYSASAVLAMFDGCGGLIEQWDLVDTWPTEVNFGDLDYSSGEVAEIELTLRFQYAYRTAYCGSKAPNPCCTVCS